MYSTSIQAFDASFGELWNNVVTAAPTFVLALVVFSLGLLVASGLGSLARKLVGLTKLDVAVEKAAAFVRLQTLGFKLKVANLIGTVVEWFFAIVTFMTVADILGLGQVTEFLRRVALYVPNVLVAILILGLGLVLARVVGQFVERAIKSSNMPSASAGALAVVAEWSVIIFALMAALTQLGVATRLIEILFTGLIFGLALAFGLSFGLGGRDHARDWLEKVTRNLSK